MADVQEAGCSSDNSELNKPTESSIKTPDIVLFAYKSYYVKDGKCGAVCKYCDQQIKETKGTTTGFIRHLKARHVTIFNKYLMHKNQPDAAEQKHITAYMYGAGDRSSMYGKKHPVQLRQSENLVSDLIVGCGLPISIVENPSFIHFVQGLDPKFCLPSRSHITAKLLPKLHESTMSRVHSHLSTANAVGLTVDVWTDRRRHLYLGITAHTFLDCVPQSLLLGFSPFKGSHTGVRIAAEIDRITTEHNVRDKVIYCLSDNASNMRNAFAVMENLSLGENAADENQEASLHDATLNVLDDEELWNDLNADDEPDVSTAVNRLSTKRLSCFAHSLQLTVGDGLKRLISARVIQSKCSKLANIVHQSALFKDAFENTFGEGTSIPATNATRWSSVYNQLAAIAELDEEKLRTLLQETNHQNLLFSGRDYASLRELISILQPFAEVTELIQGDQYPTLGCVVPSIVGLYKLITEFVDTAVYHSVFAWALLDSLRMRFRGLLERIYLIPVTTEKDKPYAETIYTTACVLDPAYNFIWLDVDHPGDVDLKLRLKNSIIADIVQEAREAGLIVKSSAANGPQNSAAIEPPIKKNKTVFASYQNRGAIDRGAGAVAATLGETIVNYINTVGEMTSWDDVKQHRLYSFVQPFLEKVFCAPATSAPVERVFSHGGIIMRPHRARLSDKTLCDIMLSRCNARFLKA